MLASFTFTVVMLVAHNDIAIGLFTSGDRLNVSLHHSLIFWVVLPTFSTDLEGR